MLPRYHILAGAGATVMILVIFSISLENALIIFLSSFLIDADHFLFYILKKKDLSFKRSRAWFFNKRKKWLGLSKDEKEAYTRPILLFHGIEFWIPVFVLGFFFNFFWFLLIGLFIHMSLEYIEMFYHNDTYYSKLSQTFTHVKNKDKKSFF